MRFRLLKKSSVFVFFLPLITLFANGRDTTEIKPFNMPDDKKFSTMVVATVGDMKITAQEFMISYEYGPAFVKREKDSPRRYLNFMIYEKLLAKEGYSKGIDKSEELNQLLSDIEADLATEQLYRRNIWNKIKISNGEIDHAIAKELITLNLKWIYKPALAEIEQDYKLIKSGLPFDSLFVRQFSDSVKYEDRFMETTRFQLERKNLLLSGIVDTLKEGEISLPIKTPGGCYIVKLENIFKNMITTESEREKLRNDVERVIFKARADSMSDQYVNKVLLTENPVIKRQIFNILKAYLGKKILPEDVFNNWDLLKNIHPAYPDFNGEDIKPFLNDKLVELKNSNITLQDFIKWYTTREPYIRFNSKSHQALYLSVQQTVWRMVRDKLLTKIAYSKKLDKLKEVKLQKNWWRDKLVYSQMKLDIANSIKLDEVMIRQYYEQNKKRYANEKGEIKSFEEVKEEVRNDLLSYEYTKRIVHKVLGLKEYMSIKINEDVLKALPIDIKNDPKAIDVYTMKNGGTFMRQAFPTIDFEWQYWN